MATWTSGVFATSNSYIKYKITIVQNSQNITANTSNVTVRVRVYRTNTGYTTYGTGSVACVINGKTYTSTISSSQKITNSGINLFSKTLNIAHGSDGVKNLTVKASISHERFTASSHSYSHALTTIPRKSTLTVANGTLNTSQTLTVVRKSTSFTHTIVATCGGSTSTICTKSTSTSITYTPPLSFANQNTTGTNLSVTYMITTYNGNTSIGSNSYTVTCAIPSNVKPSCKISVSDPTGYASTYGGYIKGKSKIKVEIKPTTSYGSAIASYNTSANGSKYTASVFTTGVITATGKLTITSTVTDRRGRSGTASTTITVLAYSNPNVSKLAVSRCNEDGTANQEGSYVKVTFNASITNLNSKNTATYMLQYKKTSESAYGSAITLSSYANQYSVSNGMYVFAADPDVSYNVRITAKDNFTSGSRTTNVSTAFTLIHFSAGGTGIAIGKIVEKENLFDVGLPVRFREGMPSNTLWTGEYQMDASQTVILKELVNKQLTGICLVFSAYKDNEAKDYDWNYFFVPKSHTIHRNGQGIDFLMSNTGFSKVSAKYIYVYNDKLVGNNNNINSGTGSSGITFDNTAFILRAVLGV